MRGSWSRTIKVSGSTAELMEIVQWAAHSALGWPGETLDWLVGDGPEPSWVALQGFDPREMLAVDTEHAATRSLQVGSTSDGEEIRAWRDQIHRAASGHADEPVWTHSALLGDDPVAFQVHSPEGVGHWAGFTLANLSLDDDRKDDTSTRDVWVRFEPQEPKPTRRWLVVSSEGWVVRLGSTPSDQVQIGVEHTDPSDPDSPIVGRGEFLFEATAERFDGVVSDLTLPDGRGLVKRFDGSFSPAGSRDRKLRVAAAGVASVRPRRWNLLTVIWPVARIGLSRRLGRAVSDGVDRAFHDSAWPILLATARSDAERRSRGTPHQE